MSKKLVSCTFCPEDTIPRMPDRICAECSTCRKHHPYKRIQTDHFVGGCPVGWIGPHQTVREVFTQCKDGAECKLMDTSRNYDYWNFSTLAQHLAAQPIQHSVS